MQRNTTRAATTIRASASYEPDAALARRLADLEALAQVIPAHGYVHGDKPTSIDAGLYGFIANIHLLRHRHAAQAFRRGAREHGAALPRHPPEPPVFGCVAQAIASAAHHEGEECPRAV